MKVAAIAEKMNILRQPVKYLFQISYPMKSQRKHFIVYIYVLKIDYVM